MRGNYSTIFYLLSFVKIITRSEEIKNLTGIREVVKLEKIVLRHILRLRDFNDLRKIVKISLV